MSKPTLCAVLFLLCLVSINAKPIVGMATWYSVASAKSEGTSGTLTASGAPYNESALTCALPKATAKAWNIRYGASVRITNIKNGRMVRAIYTDRGPGRKSRSMRTIIDLTPAAFKALGGKLRDGKIKVTIERF